MIQVDPMSAARHDWQQALRALNSRHVAFQQAQDQGTIDRVRCAILLAEAYDNERRLYESYEALVLAEVEAEIRAENW